MPLEQPFVESVSTLRHSTLQSTDRRARIITTRGFIVDSNGQRAPAPVGARAAVWRSRTRIRDADGVIRMVERWTSTKHKAETSAKAALVDREAPTTATGGLRPGTLMVDAGRIWIEQIEYADLNPKTRRSTPRSSTATSWEAPSRA